MIKDKRKQTKVRKGKERLLMIEKVFSNWAYLPTTMQDNRVISPTMIVSLRNITHKEVLVSVILPKL